MLLTPHKNEQVAVVSTALRIGTAPIPHKTYIYTILVSMALLSFSYLNRKKWQMGARSGRRKKWRMGKKMPGGGPSGRVTGRDKI